MNVQVGHSAFISRPAPVAFLAAMTAPNGSWPAPGRCQSMRAPPICESASVGASQRTSVYTDYQLNGRRDTTDPSNGQMADDAAYLEPTLPPRATMRPPWPTPFKRTAAVRQRTLPAAFK